MTRTNRSRGNTGIRKSLSRRVGQKQVKKTVVVVCEGVLTEPSYIDALKDQPEVRDGAAVRLRIEAANDGGVPLTLVRRAIDIKVRDRIEGQEIDEIWCVFDVEYPRNHPNLSQALSLARRHGIYLAISNPCFELWLMLHFRDQTATLSTAAACAGRRVCDGSSGKGIDASVYMARRETAVGRAHWLEQNHAKNRTTFPHDNPSSGMHHLVASVSQPGASRRPQARG
jgi:RloB-like protein